MKRTIVSALLPTPALLRRPGSDTRYRSSLPTEMPTTKSANFDPCSSRAAVSAFSSLSMLSVPDAQIPRRRLVFVAIAAGKAAMGVSGVFHWMFEYRRMVLNSPGAPLRFFAALNSASKSCWFFALPLSSEAPELKPRMVP